MITQFARRFAALTAIAGCCAGVVHGIAAAQVPASPQPSAPPQANATVVPFDLADNHVIVSAMVDGKGPYAFALDTGADNVVDAGVADAIGLRTHGRAHITGVGGSSEDATFTTIDTLTVGDATLHGQRFAVADLALGIAAGSAPHIDGILGYSVLSRFVTTFDYGARRVIFRARDAEDATPAPETVVPFALRGGHVYTSCTIGGFAGTCMVDTGSRLSLSVDTPFVAAHPVLAAHATAVGVDGYGFGGPAHGRLARTSLTFAGFTLTDVVADLSVQKVGAFANASLAGNIGGGTLRRFTVTFDYANRTMGLTPNAAFAVRDTYDRSGLFLIGHRGRIIAFDVRPGTPAAAAGIAVGDAIERVDGRDASQMGLGAVRAVLAAAAGTGVELTVDSVDGTSRTVKLTLRDYV